MQHSNDSDKEEMSRDYLLDYPLEERRRIAALESLQAQHHKIGDDFRAEVHELEKKYMAKHEPLYAERTKIILGQREPTAEESQGTPEDAVALVDDKGLPVSSAEKVTGVRHFWLNALRNHPGLGGLIHDSDVAALESLQDIKVSYLENGPGFQLQFYFGENEFFTSQVLSKEYHLETPVAPSTELVYDYAVGTEIDWKEGKNTCFRTVTKTQKQKNGKGTRVVKRQEPVDSFFHFFSPPQMPEEDDDSEDEEDIQELEEELEADYQIGDTIKSEIIPNAVDWFTGKALEYFDDEYFEDEEEGSEEDDSDDDSDDSEEDHDSEDDHSKCKGKHGRGGHHHAQRPGQKTGDAGAHGDAQNCKQQ